MSFMQQSMRVSQKPQSSTKIKELYQQFESLKQRITISQNKRQKSIRIEKGTYQPQKESTLQSPNITYTESRFLQTQMKTILKLTFTKFINQTLPKTTHCINEKLFILEKRLEIANNLLSQVPNCIKYKIKCQNKKTTYKCKCKVKAVNIIEVENRCNQQINKLKQAYQNKISLLMNEMKDIGTTTSSHKHKDKQIQYQLRNLEEKLLIKQQELNDIQIQNSQLRKNTDHMKKIIKRKDDFIEELKKQLENNKQHTNQLTSYNPNTSHNNHQKIKQQIQQFNKRQTILKLQLQSNQIKIVQIENKALIKQKQLEIQIKKLENILEQQQIENNRLKKENIQLLKKQTKDNQAEILNYQLNKNIQKLNQKVKKYQDQIQRLKIRQKIKDAEIQKLYNSQNNKSKIQQIQESQNQQQWNQSFMQRKNTQNSQDQNIISVLKIDSIEKLRYSYIINPKQKKFMALQYRIKQLEAQLHLVIQENKLLKSKKDKFENQIKGSEQDEQKFLIQSQIFRQQIKRLNIHLKLLDQCALIVLNKGIISKEKINQLQSSLKFTKEYKKQFID